MSIIALGVVLFVLLILLTNTKRWKGLVRGARRARSELESEARSKRPEDL
jgi:Sec-independent protein translocase protein TatA